MKWLYIIEIGMKLFAVT